MVFHKFTSSESYNYGKKLHDFDRKNLKNLRNFGQINGKTKEKDVHIIYRDKADVGVGDGNVGDCVVGGKVEWLRPIDLGDCRVAFVTKNISNWASTKFSSHWKLNIQ